jgi:hypothetical protein
LANERDPGKASLPRFDDREDGRDGGVADDEGISILAGAFFN